jgi:hypothetical protein
MRRFLQLARSPMLRLLALSGGTLACAAVASAQVAYQTIALTGEAAPSMGAGVSYLDFSGAPVQSPGRVAFVAGLTGAGVTDASNLALYAGGFGSPQLVAHEGDTPPGAVAGTAAYSNFAQVTLNDLGQIAYVAILAGNDVTEANDGGLYAGNFAAPQLIAREGDDAHGIGMDVKYNSAFIIGSLSDTGGLAYRASLAGTGVTDTNNSAIYAGDLASQQLIARKGDSAAGIGGGVTYRENFGPFLNDAGQFVHLSWLSGTAPPAANAIYEGTLASTQLIAKTGDPAIGFEAGVNYSDFHELPVINEQGQIAYSARLNGGGGSAMYAGDSNDPMLVARGGQPAPGAPAGITYHFTSGFDEPRINDNGQVAYSARLTGPGVNFDNAFAIFAGDFADPQLAVRKGDPAPGTPAGINYGTLFEFELNDAGQLAYRAELSGPGVSSANEVGLFAFDPARGNLLIARAGDLFDVGGGDMRSVAANGIGLAAGFGGDDLRGALSNDGTIVFRLTFNDGTSGIFTAHIPDTIPGDTDFDDDVDLADLGNLASSYGLSSDNIKWQNGDFDHDDDVDLNDLGTLASNYQSGQSQAFADFATLTTVPEPASVTLVLGGVIALWRLRERR